jgi:DNA invertase Pin-like site-specific DNA recombinase
MKKAYTLYRVSTTGQVVDDDIPMQKEACHQYAKAQGWQIVKEFYEKGISGFKVSANDRDQVQELLKAAKNKEFDVLLIYKLDRLGRIEDETPIILQTFINLGVEVWSTIEGQRHATEHIDGLINYLYFWQAAGESKNTSIRVKTRMKQLTEEGVYTGGPVPYGYKLVDNGRKNKKDLVCFDLQIDEQTAEMVKIIFNLTLQLGMGSYRVARYLNEKGYRTRNGTEFQCNTINRILRNEIYTGYIIKGDARSKHLPHLQIIDDSSFSQTQEILKKRGKINESKNQIAAVTKSKVLLSGLVFCGHCGGRMTPERYQDKYIRKDGTEYRKDEMKYCCYHKRRKLCECDGQTTYKADAIDAAVSEVIRSVFMKIKVIPDRHTIDKNIKQLMQKNIAVQKKRWHEIEKTKLKLKKLQSEIANALIGESAFEADELAETIRNTKEQLRQMEELYRTAQDSMEDEKNKFASIIPSYEKFKGWANEFEMADLERKKAIVNLLINTVDISRSGITVQFNIDYQQFLGEWENEIIPFDKLKIS